MEFAFTYSEQKEQYWNLQAVSGEINPWSQLFFSGLRHKLRKQIVLPSMEGVQFWDIYI